MIPLNLDELQSLATQLEKYDCFSTISRLAGLLTVPSLHANSIRLETLVHLAVAHCGGSRKPNLETINHWLTDLLGNTSIVSLEDPSEDVFITNVISPHGNCRIFEGCWNSSDYYAQTIVDVLRHRGLQKFGDLLFPAFALLKLSDCVAERVGLQRWHVEDSTPRNMERLSPYIKIFKRTKAVTFTDRDLISLKINRAMLAPFILKWEGRQSLKTETTGHTSLEKSPLLEISGRLVLTLPHAVSPAIRRFILKSLWRKGNLLSLARWVSTHQAKQIELNGLKKIKNIGEYIDSPISKNKIPLLQDWIIQHDINRYLHVVLVSDRLTKGPDDLSSFMKFCNDSRENLQKYLNGVAQYCQSLASFADGMTLVVIGGIGRGLSLGFEEISPKWSLSILTLPDFLMVANEPDSSIHLYLKCIKQRQWYENNGIEFNRISSDYDFYCYWRRNDYQIVPKDYPWPERYSIWISGEFVLPIKKEVRKLVDIHGVLSTSRRWIISSRLDTSPFFESLKTRPIFVSLFHAISRILYGAIETPHGPSWLRIDCQTDDKRILDFQLSMWEGFIGLFERLVFEAEPFYRKIPDGPLEIQLDFSSAIVRDDFIFQESEDFIDLKFRVNHSRRTAIVYYPSETIQCFNRPENIGEKVVLRGIAACLLQLYNGADKEIEKDIIFDLVNKVVSDPGIRVFHVFRIYDEIEKLQDKFRRSPIFLPMEDFVFSKMKLSEGCWSNPNATHLTTKNECNEFLHKVVEKIWRRLKGLLQQLARAEVIRKMLQLFEAILYDRTHWGRTAQAIHALHSQSDDVTSIARDREKDRSDIGLAARTIMEMAICECPEAGGRPPSRGELDGLLANVALLLEVATHSDAIINDFTPHNIKLHPNGEYTIDRSYHAKILEPYFEAYYKGKFEKDVESYGDLYEHMPSGENSQDDEIFHPGFEHAFQAEYRLTLDEIKEGIGELIDLFVESDKLILETTVGHIKSRLISNRSFSIDTIDAFFQAFGSFHRPKWESPPKGFKPREIYPWRYKRRLAVISKPILVFGQQDDNKVMFSAGMLKLALCSLLERINDGNLPQRFFTSQKMKKYVGMINNKKGHDFARYVAKKLEEKNWNTRNEINLTEIGASGKLGDIDVLAWKTNGEVQIIECKRLMFAKTVAEVAEICRRFRGEAGDALDKHVRRVNWIKSHPGNLSSIIGFTPSPRCIQDRLVTNTHVPMTYLKSLPISPDKIGPLKE